MNASTGMPRTRRRVGIAAAVAVVIALAAPLSAAAAGKDGVGDPYFPDDGNPGYDVRHYGLDVSYDPATDNLVGTAVITATASKSLSSFNLDLDGLDVSSVRVNARTASYERSGGELIVTPSSKLKKGLPFVTIVRYSGVPESLEGAGFLATDDGVLVAGQPHVASSWFPVNDHPSDKALYTIRITVPQGLQAISNGRLISQRDQGGDSIWLWNVDEPMASYLATIDIGEFDVDAYTEDGIAYWDALDPDLFALPIVPRTGTSFAYSGSSELAYSRLQRTIQVDAASPELSFWVDRDTEADWDFAFVEIAPTGTDDWTTIGDTGGILSQYTGFSAPGFTAACDVLAVLHPFLAHYLSHDGDGACLPVGSTGQWWAATGASDGWEQWAFDLSAYAGQQVDVAISYVTDDVFSFDGVAVEDVVAPGGDGTTSFEDDGDSLDGWTVPGAPDGSPGNETDWMATSVSPPPIGVDIAASFARQPEIIAALESWFGDYPFDEAGGIVDDLEGLGFALETQTRPVYSKDFWSDGQNDGVVVHELAHQWFGDSVPLDRWADIWLNEGFATYAEWLWSEYDGGPAPQDYFEAYYNGIPDDDPFWSVVIGDPGPDLLFDGAVYDRGAMTLQALRNTIGDDAFFELLPRWHDSHEKGNATTKEFIALAEEVSGMKLGKLFDAWLYTGERPAEVPNTDVQRFGAGGAPKVTLPRELREY
ncbi:M1 family metallopeptidase [Microbacterium sp. NPDC019599]|uniref:M1 family metallopeptidase n=1 Tax=Microbacterium sp. NPDC019599 TaxID=3154690 RepID=UPI0033DFEC3D